MDLERQSLWRFMPVLKVSHQDKTNTENLSLTAWYAAAPAATAASMFLWSAGGPKAPEDKKPGPSFSEISSTWVVMVVVDKVVVGSF